MCMSQVLFPTFADDISTGESVTKPQNNVNLHKNVSRGRAFVFEEPEKPHLTDFNVGARPEVIARDYDQWTENPEKSKICSTTPVARWRIIKKGWIVIALTSSCLAA